VQVAVRLQSFTVIIAAERVVNAGFILVHLLPAMAFETEEYEALKETQNIKLCFLRHCHRCLKKLMTEKVFCKSNHMHYSMDGQADPNQQNLPTGFILSDSPPNDC